MSSIRFEPTGGPRRASVPVPRSPYESNRRPVVINEDYDEPDDGLNTVDERNRQSRVRHENYDDSDNGSRVYTDEILRLTECDWMPMDISNQRLKLPYTPRGTLALDNICNKRTISKDNTIGEQARINNLLADFGNKRIKSSQFHKASEGNVENPGGRSLPQVEPVKSLVLDSPNPQQVGRLWRDVHTRAILDRWLAPQQQQQQQRMQPGSGSD